MERNREKRRKIKRAIVSVSNKEGLLGFVEGLRRLNVKILSTGGTQRYLLEGGVSVRSISDYTGFPEILEGRVKTLHPKIHGGILACRDKDTHMESLKDAGIEPIDMVVVNLYPFEETISEGCEMDVAQEEIDIGGPTMIRAAAKNFNDVAVVTDPADYDKVLKEMESLDGALSFNTRLALAKKVFMLTSMYDHAIYSYLASQSPGEESIFPDNLLFSFQKKHDLRYGENPHQKAAFYMDCRNSRPSVSSARKLQGKELSFNNILDLDAAQRLVREFNEPCIVIVKHNNPCGIAESGSSLKDAYLKALSCDPVSAFGSIIASNRNIDRETAQAMSKIFIEAIIAPGFDSEAREIFSKKKNLRLMEIPLLPEIGDQGPGMRNQVLDRGNFDLRKVDGGLLVQSRDDKEVDINALKVVTWKKPTKEQVRDMLFAWRVCKHVKSNAIVFAKESQTIGIGAGQMSRVDAVRIGIMKAKDGGLSLEGAVMASDAFFPFRDSIDIASKEGISAVIQPGGSIRDEEVINGANEHGLAMAFTGVRHFRH